MKQLLFIVIALFFCLCSCNKNKTSLHLTELDQKSLDKSFLNIIKDYEATYPNDSNIVVYFNVDSNHSVYYASGIYFTIGEFEIPYFEATSIIQNKFLPSFYFVLEGKKVFVASSSNTILRSSYSRKVLQQDYWLKAFFDKSKHDGWLVKYDYNRGYQVINKKCDIYTGTDFILLPPKIK